jgi:hypothetical protein
MDPPRAGAGEWQLRALAAAGYVGIVLVLFGDVMLLSSEGRIASSWLGDTARYFVFMREIVASELAAGNIPLWNPHSFSGTPLLGAFQPAVFYPPNLVYLVLPLALAIDVELALHIALLGFASFVWLRGWRLHPAACFFGGCVVALSGASFLRVLAGQLTVIDTLAWSPFVLWAIDRVGDRRGLDGPLVGIAAITLMILAGHPPTVFMCGVVFALYCIPIVLRAEARGRVVGALVLMAAAPLCLSAIQLWAGLEVAHYGNRAGGMPLDFASSFSLPPENLLTLIAPDMLGGGRFSQQPYYGRWVYWDATAYVGLIALVLACSGAIAGRSPLRSRAVALCGVALALALGIDSPVYRWLYDWMPGFDHIRAPSKFIFHFALFGAALSALGLDALLRAPERGRSAWIALGSIGAVVVALTIWAWVWPPRSGGVSLPQLMAGLNEQPRLLPLILVRWNAALLDALLVSCVLLASMAVLLQLARRRRWAMPLLLVVGVAELASFAYGHRGAASTHSEYRRHPGLRAAYAHAGEDRVLRLGQTSNIAVALRGYDLWGYEAVILGRYVRFMARSQERHADDLNNIDGHHPDRFHPVFSMLRGRISMDRSEEIIEHPAAGQRFALVRSYRLVADELGALDGIFAPGFDPSIPLLEAEPIPAPDPQGEGGRVELRDESTDHLDLAIELDSAAILLISDAYAPGWRVRDLESGSLDAYRVQPANSVMRAIALPAGEHALRIEYAPAGYLWGRWVSGLSCMIFFGAVTVRVRRRLQA